MPSGLAPLAPLAAMLAAAAVRPATAPVAVVCDWEEPCLERELEPGFGLEAAVPDPKSLPEACALEWLVSSEEGVEAPDLLEALVPEAPWLPPLVFVLDPVRWPALEPAPCPVAALEPARWLEPERVSESEPTPELESVPRPPPGWVPPPELNPAPELAPAPRLAGAPPLEPSPKPEAGSRPHWSRLRRRLWPPSRELG